MTLQEWDCAAEAKSQQWAENYPIDPTGHSDSAYRQYSGMQWGESLAYFTDPLNDTASNAFETVPAVTTSQISDAKTTGHPYVVVRAGTSGMARCGKSNADSSRLNENCGRQEHHRALVGGKHGMALSALDPFEL